MPHPIQVDLSNLPWALTEEQIKDFIGLNPIKVLICNYYFITGSFID